MDLLNIFDPSKEFERISLRPNKPSYAPSESSVASVSSFNTRPASFTRGTDYAKKYIEAEKAKALQVRHYIQFWLLYIQNNTNSHAFLCNFSQPNYQISTMGNRSTKCPLERFQPSRPKWQMQNWQRSIRHSISNTVPKIIFLLSITKMK